jgi:hypothetical protein
VRILDDTVVRDDRLHLPKLWHDITNCILALNLRGVGVLGEDGGDVGLP